MTVALTERWEDFTPITVEERVDQWEQWLAHDPADTQEARDERRIREIMEAA
jgi:hypothetical protein